MPDGNGGSVLDKNDPVLQYLKTDRGGRRALPHGARPDAGPRAFSGVPHERSVRRRLPGGGAGRPVPVRRPVRLEAHGRAPAGPAQPGPAQLRRAGAAGRAAPAGVGPALKR
ncbi:hypothetical protein G6F59_018718 [Rhizopus arrhizus]|nr:hypothetical protein G6F59_018718 [Rhizopus arrhizus]